jgi:tetratricopeptide (TPR) repeat protein
MKSSYQTIIIFFIFVLISCVIIAQPPHRTKDGEFYGVLNRKYMGQWYDDYEVALDYAKGAFWDDAKKYFLKALIHKKNDKRMVTTYGTHFMDYFPNREMGIIHYYQGNLHAAVQLLEKSIASQSSPRALFYLNCVRRALSRKQNVDHQPPSIYAQFPDTVNVEKFLTNKYQLSIAGKITDNDFIQSVFINGEQIPITMVDPKIQLNEIISLTSDENIVQITATDVSGNMSTQIHKIFLDVLSPLITFDKGSKGSLIIGHIMDSSGLKKVDILLDDQLYPYEIQTKSQIVKLHYQIPEYKSFSSAYVRAVDMAGNITTIAFDINRSLMTSQPVLLASQNLYPGMLAKNQDKPGIEIYNYDEIKNLISKEIATKIIINHPQKVKSVSIIVNDEKENEIKGRFLDLETNQLKIIANLKLNKKINIVKIEITPKQGKNFCRDFRFYVHEEIRDQCKMNVALVPSSFSKYTDTQKVKDNFDMYLSSRFTLNTNFKSIEDYKKYLSHACMDDYISCMKNNQEQAPLWIAEFDFGKLESCQKPSKIFQEDNSEFNLIEFARGLTLDVFRVIRGKDPEYLTIYKLEGNLTLYYMKNGRREYLIDGKKIGTYFESTQKDDTFIIEQVCKYLTQMLIKRLPVVESDISEIETDTYSFYPDINPIPYHIKPGLRMMVYYPIFNRIKEKVFIAEAEVSKVDKNSVRATLYNPTLMDRLKISHRVIIR